MSTNTSLGDGAIANVTTGENNTAIGNNALTNLTIGSSNVGVGYNTLYYDATGENNTALGNLALIGTTGSNNIGIGYGAGRNNISGHDNIYIQNDGTGSSEENTIRIGQNKLKCFISGIYEKVFVNTDAKYPIGIAADGQLGRMEIIPVGTILRLPTTASTPSGYILLGTEAIHYTDTGGHPITLNVNLYQKQ
jgi:hypothetical protein